MKRSAKILIIILAAAVALSAAALLLAPARAVTARIYLDGELFAEIDLSAVEEAYTLAVGAGNTVLVERGRISMLEADCPDKLCVRHGAASPLSPVVCLPNRVEIDVDGKRPGDADVITGGAMQ